MKNAFFLLVWAANFSFAAPQFHSVKVYKGAEGAKVVVIHLADSSGAVLNEALIKYTGTLTKGDGKVQKLQWEETGNGRNYFRVTKKKRREQRYVWLTTRDASITLYPPEIKSEVSLKFDEKGTESFDGPGIFPSLLKESESPAN